MRGLGDLAAGGGALPCYLGFVDRGEDEGEAAAAMAVRGQAGGPCVRTLPVVE